MDRLEGILDSIYESALETGDWSATIMRIADFCGVENASLVAIDPRIDLALVTSPRADPDIIRQYNDTWWQHDPTAAATADASPGTVTDLATTGRELFFSSEFYGEYWSRSGLGAERIASNLYVDDGAFSSVVLQAGVRNDEIADETRARFDLLLPHLIRALRANRRLHALEMEATAVRLGGHGGFIAVDGACRIHGMDAVAERLVGQRRGVGVRRGQVVFDDVAVHRTVVHRVHRCMAGQLAGGGVAPLRFGCPKADRALSVEVLPLRGGQHPPMPGLADGSGTLVLLVFRDPDAEARRKVEALRQAFGLTNAEAQLAIEVAKGDGREAAAARCGITVNTARSHLSRIFEKTGVSRQAELVNLIASASDRF
ncbi:MAG: helix-turn-helix transcriptional regulator [Roseitalea porphyridii]|jgi:DNA-binding CsgD family transcriptional regulator|uniref:helix-turn-helix transcriptional regulator n=1 Tax=Roseitalea porphyridii TaxID=1852022 RepID=UPI0032EBBCBF